MRYGRVVGLLIGLLACYWALEASAGWLSAYSGYSAFSSGGTDGYVSFAVWDRGEHLNDNPTLPSGTNKLVWNGGFNTAPDFQGRYIYFYQVVNAQSGESSLRDFRIYDSPDAFLQVGYLEDGTNGVVFVDTQGSVMPAANPMLDNGRGNTNNGADDIAGDGQPTLSGEVPSGLASVSGPLFPTSIDLSFGSHYIQWNFTQDSFINDTTSSILFVTSDLAPVYRKSEERDGAIADCDVPATPEPSTVIGLVTLALAGGGLGLIRRRRKA